MKESAVDRSLDKRILEGRIRKEASAPAGGASDTGPTEADQAFPRMRIGAPAEDGARRPFPNLHLPVPEGLAGEPHGSPPPRRGRGPGPAGRAQALLRSALPTNDLRFVATRIWQHFLDLRRYSSCADLISGVLTNGASAMTNYKRMTAKTSCCLSPLFEQENGLPRQYRRKALRHADP